MVGFALSCFALLLFLWLSFGGSTPLKPQGYRFTTSFGEATQLATQADVRISGVSVGKVQSITTDPKTGRSDAVVEVDAKYAPLPRDIKAILRQKTLLGETYVELTPGNRSAGMIPDGGTLPASRVSDTVELDEILRTFDPETRAAFQQWMQQQAVALDGNGRALNAAIANLAPFTEDTQQLLTILNGQSSAVRQVVRNTGRVANALSTRSGQLSGLVTNANRVFSTTARRNTELAQAIVALPAFERESAATLTRLRQFTDDANPLITQLRPAARELTPTLQDLQALSPDLRALFRDLDPAITASRRGLPAVQRTLQRLRPTLAAASPALRQLNPVLRFIQPYTGEMNAFFANTAAATEATSTPANGADPLHYLRTLNPLNLESVTSSATKSAANRSNPYQQAGAFAKLAQGLGVYDTRSCSAATPKVSGVDGPVTEAQPTSLDRAVSKFALGNTPGSIPAVPCKAAGTFGTTGRMTQFPQVAADAGPTRPASTRAARP
jgi:phospholipid/cholesterol/gamma-HCH transport system substrate-binding protein